MLIWKNTKNSFTKFDSFVYLQTLIPSLYRITHFTKLVYTFKTSSHAVIMFTHLLDLMRCYVHIQKPSCFTENHHHPSRRMSKSRASLLVQFLVRRRGFWLGGYQTLCVIVFETHFYSRTVIVNTRIQTCMTCTWYKIRSKRLFKNYQYQCHPLISWDSSYDEKLRNSPVPSIIFRLFIWWKIEKFTCSIHDLETLHDFSKFLTSAIHDLETLHMSPINSVKLLIMHHLVVNDIELLQSLFLGVINWWLFSDYLLVTHQLPSLSFPCHSIYVHAVTKSIFRSNQFKNHSIPWNPKMADATSHIFSPAALRIRRDTDR